MTKALCRDRYVEVEAFNWHVGNAGHNMENYLR